MTRRSPTRPIALPRPSAAALPIAAVLSLLLVLSGALSPASAADSATGKMTYAKTSLTFVDAYAFQRPDSFDATKKATVLTYSTVKLDRKGIDGALDRVSEIDSQIRKGEGSSVEMAFDSAGDLVGFNAQLRTESGFQSLSSSGAGKAELATNTAERLAGRVFTDGPQTLLGEKCSFDFKFDLAITPEPPPGKPLAAGGGEAGKAYVAYIAALQKGNPDAIAKFWPKEKADMLLAAKKEPDFKEKLEMLQMFSPKSVSVKGGSSKGESADLDVVGKDADGNVMDGKVRMVKSGKSWVVEKEDLTTHTK